MPYLFWLPGCLLFSWLTQKTTQLSKIKSSLSCILLTSDNSLTMTPPPPPSSSSTAKWRVWIILVSRETILLFCHSCQMSGIRTRESETYPVLDWLLTNGANRGHRMASYSSQVLMTGELSLDVIRGTCWSMEHAKNRMFSTLHTNVHLYLNRINARLLLIAVWLYKQLMFHTLKGLCYLRERKCVNLCLFFACSYVEICQWLSRKCSHKAT